ncbi:hypothetical protein ACH4C6_04955 [Streptomyces sp. NPDC017943]|uniref:hypothetical protein n=1 Tax=Streptomyces sp. NPDC017943 TaxID=3365019 RepID=UPI00378C0894
MEENRAAGTAFIIMPFTRELDWLHHTIVSACLAEGVKPKRGDDVFEPGSVLNQILADIDAADIVFAVCTGKSANVFFELGYAWKQHDPILIAEDTHDLPFDIAAYRAALYGQENPSGARETLEWRLRRSIRAILDREQLPKGKALTEPPARKGTPRITATLHNVGRGSRRFVLSNTGTSIVKQVSVEVPPEASSFHLLDNDLPLDVLRPGESVRLLASVVMGGGKSIFDVIIKGMLEDGTPVEFPVKISL